MSFYHIRQERATLDVSIIVPLKDEEDNVRELADEISEIMRRMDMTWECLWIDDGSQDGTMSALHEIHRLDFRHRYISLRRNFGQSAALAVGFSNARGKIFLTMDGDGQNDPKDIPHMIETLVVQQCQMVQGWRRNRNDRFIRRISSRIANGFRNLATRDYTRDVGCSMRAFRRECVANMMVFKGMHRFLPMLVRMNGYPSIVEIPVHHRPRRRGETKYGIRNRLFVGLKDTYGVLWMKSRIVSPEARVSSPEQEKKEE